MKSYIDILMESIDTVTSDETKFWYSSRENRFVDHDIDTHHTKMLATDPTNFNLTDDEVAHHPHASGQYGDYDEFGDDDDDDEEYADNEDGGMFALAFERGWVRGGHEIDVMQYHDFGDVRHDGRVYLQGDALAPIQKCVRACMKRWPDLMGFTIESGQRFFQLDDHDQIKRFIRGGVIPS